MPLIPGAKQTTDESILKAYLVPDELDQLVAQCLEKSPDRRPANARTLLALLDAIPLEHAWDQESAAGWWTRHAPDL